MLAAAALRVHTKNIGLGIGADVETVDDVPPSDRRPHLPQPKGAADRAVWAPPLPGRPRGAIGGPAPTRQARSTALESTIVTQSDGTPTRVRRSDHQCSQAKASIPPTGRWQMRFRAVPGRGAAPPAVLARGIGRDRATPSRRLLRLVAGCGLVAALTACTTGASPVASPTAAAPQPTTASCPAVTSGGASGSTPASDPAINYLALGDSLTVGYQPSHGEDRTGGFVGAVFQDWRCRRPGAQLTNLACIGESTTAAVTGAGSGCSYPEGSQLAAALASLHKGGGAGLVTLTLGTPDVFPCTHAGIDQSCVADRLHAFEVNLTSILTQLRAAAPSARLVVLTSYNPLLATYAGDPDTPSTDPPKLVSPQVATQSTEMFAQLNRTLAAVATKTGARVADVSGAFAATDTTGSPLPVNVQRLCDWTWLCRVGDTHPNDAGYAAMARAVIAAT